MAERSWFFQANPTIYRVREALVKLPQLFWSVNQFSDDIHVDDLVFIWESGQDGGLIAQTRVVSELHERSPTPEELEFYVAPPDDVDVPGVDLRIEQVFERPLTRAELLAEPAIAQTRLLNNPRGTNFPITDAELQSLRLLLQPEPTFRTVCERYQRDQIVFRASERPVWYSVQSLDDTGCVVARLSADEPVRVTYALHESRVQTMEARRGKMPRQELSGTSAIRALLVQSPSIGLSADHEFAVLLDDEESSLRLLDQIIGDLAVDKSSGTPKLYKPAMLAAVVRSIEQGETRDHRIHFDVVLPRFIEVLAEQGISAGPDQAAMAFYHLTSDLVWNLSYKNLDDRIDSVSASAIRSKVTFACLKEPIAWLLRKHANREAVLESIARHWWSNNQKRSTVSFWWVNQGKTYDKEKDASVIWAPQQDKSGKTNFHWTNVSRVAAGDIVFHYVVGQIKAVSVCRESGVKAPKPVGIGASTEQAGWQARCEYVELPEPIPRERIARSIRQLNLKYGPINRTEGSNQGYLYELPPAAARIIAEQIHLDDLPPEVAAPLQELIGNKWDQFIHWAKRFWDDPAVRSGEIDYKLRIAERVKAANEALARGEDWLVPLRQAFRKGNNLTVYRTHDPFLAWCQKEPETAEQVLKAVWRPDVDGAEAIVDMLAILPDEAVKGAGTRNHVASFLAMGRDPHTCPIYKPTVFEKGCSLTGFAAFPVDEAGYYQHALDFLDRIRSEAAARGLNLNDRLESQSVLWCVAKYAPPETWPEEDRGAFLAFQAGAEPSDPVGGTRPTLETIADDLFLDSSFVEEIATLIAAKRQLVFYGPPGTGKTYIAKTLAKHFAHPGGQVEIVQFHPSYAYEDFIEGFRPQVDGSQAGFRLAKGPLRRLALKARKHPDSTFVLLIDEINRGNVAKVFGELYFLLEYRDEEISLQYSRKRFALPPNLWIIGTMNTADRSIALIDAALRRRFFFIPFFPDERPVSEVLRRWLSANKPELGWVADIVDNANRKLANRHAAIGPSHFMRPELDEQWVRLIWKHAITPYLAEQFFGDDERVKEFDLDRLMQAGDATVTDL